MNILVLDEHPVTCAEYLSDFHITKKCDEYTYILTHYITKNIERFSKPPSLLICKEPHDKIIHWLNKSDNNVVWLLEHMGAVHTEYFKRFKKVHHLTNHFVQLRDNVQFYFMVNNIPTDWRNHTPFLVMMPDMYMTFENPVDCYRYYYTLGKTNYHWYNKSEKPTFLTDTKYTVKMNGFEANSSLSKMVAKYKDKSIGEHEKDMIYNFIKKEADKIDVPVHQVINTRYEKRENFYFRYKNEMERTIFKQCVYHLFGDIPIYLVYGEKRKIKEYRLWLTEEENIKLTKLFDFHSKKANDELKKIIDNVAIAYISKNNLTRRDDMDYDYSDEYTKNGKPYKNKDNKSDVYTALNISNAMNYHRFVDGIEEKTTK